MGRMISIPQLSLSEALNASTSKIFQFRGRSRRSEFWWTTLIVFLASIVLTPIVGFFLDIATIPLKFRRLHDIGRSGWWYGVYLILKILFFVCIMFDIIMMIINAANMVDYGEDIVYVFVMKYLLWIIVIFIYQVVLLIFMCIDSEIEENDYGESPKYKILDE